MFPDSQKLDCVSVSKSVSDENRSIFGVSDHIGKRDVIVVFDFFYGDISSVYVNCCHVYPVCSDSLSDGDERYSIGSNDICLVNED